MSLQVAPPTFLDLIHSSAPSFRSLELIRNSRLYLQISKPSAPTEMHTFTEGEFSKDNWLLLRMYAFSVEPLAHMTIFRLTESPFFTEAEMLHFLSKIPNLEELELTGSMEVTDYLVKGIGEMCPRLRKLNLSFCPKISDLNPLASCNITSLSIAECKSVTDASLKEIIHKKKLTYLNVVGTEVSEDSLLNIASCLETLIIGRSNIGISRLAKQDLSSLRKFFLLEMQIKDSDLAFLANSAPYLQEVSLKGSKGFSLDSLGKALKSWRSLRLLIQPDGYVDSRSVG